MMTGFVFTLPASKCGRAPALALEREHREDMDGKGEAATGGHRQAAYVTVRFRCQPPEYALEETAFILDGEFTVGEDGV